MVGVGRAGLEFQVLIPDAHLIVLGVDKKRPDAGNICGLSGPEQGILEECLAQALSLLCPVNCKPGEKHHRNRMPGQPLADPVGVLCVLNRANCQTVVRLKTSSQYLACYRALLGMIQRRVIFIR